MYAKDEKNDKLISQQYDLMEVNHKNINKIESIHLDMNMNRHVIIS